MTDQSMLTGGAVGPAVWFEAPVGFTELPLDIDPGNRTTLILEGLDALYPQVPVEQKLSATLSAEAGLRAQLAQGLRYAASCLYRASDGRVIHGLFQLSVRATATGEPLTFAQRGAPRLAAARPHAEVGVLGLPCGRVLVATEDHMVRVPGTTFGVAEDSVVTLRQLEALLAHPDGRHLVAVVFSTGDLDYWEEWLPVLANALSGLSFYPPQADGPPPPGTTGDMGIDRIRQAFG
ncbi:hypothetical protein P3T35_004635 [Kitasatospora sp. GP30]|uniref:hypothetical protein n=1 Tax=Kitasatospora sp. GP30 TaxID=3035084 RepID=UPI00117F1730|nr:hypothetical protein [Kitasatospora sp. GP30]MDH6142607.1 hypothetical protein [Kitasatospora sp. GP30]